MPRMDGKKRFSPRFTSALSALLQLPKTCLGNHCLLCSRPHQVELPLCNDCKLELPWLTHHCERCALPMHQGAELCGKCLRKPPSFDRCWAAMLYANPIDRLIHQFKDRRQLLQGTLLSRLLQEYLQSHLSRNDWPDVITCVPLHWRRQLGRGFNQSSFVAMQLSRSFELPFSTLCKRRLATPNQQQLTRPQRLRNLKSAFCCEEESVNNRHITIVDDVVTTQSTVEALSQTLIKAGARRVDVWAIARTPAPQ